MSGLSLWSHGLLFARLPCLSLSPRVCSNSCPLSHWMCLPTISPSVPSLLLLPSVFPSIRVFSNELAIPIRGGQSIGASASTSVLSLNIQGWFPLGLTVLIPLLSKRLSRVFYSTTVWKCHLFGTQPSLQTKSTPVCDYWENHSFDSTAICQQSDISTFQHAV